jgi:hypothetical protein
VDIRPILSGSAPSSEEINLLADFVKIGKTLSKSNFSGKYRYMKLSLEAYYNRKL